MPREIVEVPFLEILKTPLDVVLGNLLQLTLLEQGLETSRDPFPPQPFCDFLPQLTCDLGVRGT